MISSFIAVNFGFMYTLTGRVIFLLFVGFMSYSLSIFGKAAMALLYLVGFIHAIIMCRFPKFSQYVRERDYTSAAAKK
jgi:COPI associated protein